MALTGLRTLAANNSVAKSLLALKYVKYLEERGHSILTPFHYSSVFVKIPPPLSSFYRKLFRS